MAKLMYFMLVFLVILAITTEEGEGYYTGRYKIANEDGGVFSYFELFLIHIENFGLLYDKVQFFSFHLNFVSLQ